AVTCKPDKSLFCSKLLLVSVLSQQQRSKLEQTSSIDALPFDAPTILIPSDFFHSFILYKRENISMLERSSHRSCFISNMSMGISQRTGFLYVVLVLVLDLAL
ncbi:hypothetical protein STEG23_018644, partial [Scotinomys teguina]